MGNLGKDDGRVHDVDVIIVTIYHFACSFANDFHFCVFVNEGFARQCLRRLKIVLA